MAQEKRNRRTLITTISVLAVLLIAIGTVGLFKLLGSNKEDPYKQPTTSQSPSDDSKNDSQPSEDTPVEGTKPATEQPEIDPSTVSTVDIVPMDITVSYIKGIGGFQYEVLRAANGTRYVEFRSTTLEGTKCTNDKGTFASIIANPTESESTGLAKTTTVDDVKYGLALADTACTSDTVKLQEYQKSFSDAFSLLKNIEP